MSSWERITSELGLAQACEAKIHPHDPRERAELFHARDASGCTEFEFLNLLHAFTLALKPQLVLETGTFTGMGTLAIASALSWNGFGELVTVDLEDCADAKECVEKHGLAHHVVFRRENAIDFCATYDGEPFNMAFIDSGPGRLVEANSLDARRKLTEGALVIAHDASPFRVNSNPSWGEIFEKDCTIPGHTIPLSRGIRMMWA